MQYMHVSQSTSVWHRFFKPRQFGGQNCIIGAAGWFTVKKKECDHHSFNACTTYECAHLPPFQHPVLLTEAPLNPRSNRLRAAEVRSTHTLDYMYILTLHLVVPSKRSWALVFHGPKFRLMCMCTIVPRTLNLH